MKVLFVDGTPGHNPRELYLKPTGGTLTSLTKIPKYLAAHKGYEVYVQSEYKRNDVVDNVNYCAPDTAIPKWDVTVFNRNLINQTSLDYSKSIGAKSILWIHDLVDERHFKDNSFKEVDRIVGMSQYSIDTYSNYYSIPKEKFVLIPNGVDPFVFHAGKYENKDRNLFITASAPHRGFDTIETIYWALLKKNPNLDFRVYSNQSLHGQTNSAEQDKHLRRFKEIGIKVLDPLTQPDLADVMRKAWAVLMPYKIPETCCNILLQAQACGTPVLSTNIGANREWITHEETGLLTTWLPNDYFNWLKDCANQSVRLYEDLNLHKRISENSVNSPYSWSLVYSQWDKLLHSIKGDN